VDSEDIEALVEHRTLKMLKDLTDRDGTGALAIPEGKLEGVARQLVEHLREYFNPAE
jgi:hypothetical protein